MSPAILKMLGVPEGLDFEALKVDALGVKSKVETFDARLEKIEQQNRALYILLTEIKEGLKNG